MPRPYAVLMSSDGPLVAIRDTPAFAENLYALGPLPPVTPEPGSREHQDHVDLHAGRRGHHRLVAWPVLAVQGGDVVADVRADDHQALGIGHPLLIGELVGDGVLITHLVEADPGVPRTADNQGAP
jgi:hypothetical protein